jgi:HD-like signal output (HDOD) protein
MKANCPGCHKVYDIPDERLPTGKMIAFHCPGCKAVIKLGLRPETGIDDSGDKSQNIEKSPSKSPPPSAPEAEKKQGDKAFKEKVSLGLMGNLPPMPQVVLKAQEILSNPDSSIKELVKVIATDQAITTRILKLANSVYYGLSGKVSSIGHASVLLGGKILGEVIMMAGTMNLLGKTLKGYGLESEDLWRHSLAVGVGSKLIANKKNRQLENDAFTAGIIHDTGKIMLDKYILERKEGFDAFLQDGEQTFLSAEKEILGFNHAEIGSEVCRNWGVPESLTIAIGYHHNPSSSHESELAYFVHLADYIALISGIGSKMDEAQYQLDDTALEFLDFQEEDLGSIMAEVVQAVEKLAQKMQTD